MDKVPKVPPLSRKNIEMATSRLLQKLQPETIDGKHPVDIEHIFEFYVRDTYKIITGYKDLSYLGPQVLGFTDASTRTSFVDSSLIEANDIPTKRRCRATTAHEIAHCILHVPISNSFQSSSFHGFYRVDKSKIKRYEDPEWQAWEFASCILMPKNVIADYIKSGYSKNDIARAFDVNRAFVEVRIDKLKFAPL